MSESSETEARKTPRSRKSSSSFDEANSIGKSPPGGTLKKGPWTSTEDAILVEYVTKHGEGNWNAVQKYSGLSRCGKSCRLRWANHLRPDLKKGAFTPEEEGRIIELHAKMGNKWARMAAELPGRTDNEIKNFWNTRIKRLQRAGIPIYPPELRVQAMSESQQSEDMGNGRLGEKHNSDASEEDRFDLPAIEFKCLELNQGFLNHSPSSLLDIPAGGSFLHRGSSPTNSFGYMLPTVHPLKRFRETEALPLNSSIGSTSDAFSSFDHYDDDAYGKFAQSFWSPFPYDPDINIHDTSHDDMLQNGGHLLINGNNSASEPLSGTMKLELPSLQYAASQEVGSWIPSSPLPSLESVDTLIQSPLSEHTLSNCPSPRSSGLLEAVVYESHSLKSAKDKNSYHQTVEKDLVAGGDLIESSSQNVGDTNWEGSGDPISPLSQSAASVFIDYTPRSGSSSEEPQSTETMLAAGFKTKPEVSFDWVTAESAIADDEKDNPPLEGLRPDAMLDSFWFGHRIGPSKEQIITGDVGTLVGDDPSCEYKKQGGGLSIESKQSFAAADDPSAFWDNTSDIHQYPDNR